MSHGIRITRGVAGLFTGIAAAALLLGLAPSAAQAQSFNDAIQGALGFQCRGLRGSPPSADYQSSLSDICGSIPNVPGSSSGGSIAIQGNSQEGSEQRRILRRLEEKRQEARDSGIRAASADSGQMGPLGFFLTSEFEWINKSASPNEAGFDSDSKGAIVGFDYGLTKMVTVGLAIHYSRADGEFDGQGGSFHTDNLGVTLYASASPFPNFFIDGTIGYIYREYETNRRATYIAPMNPAGVTDGFAHSNTSGDEFNLGVNAGYDFFMKALTFGPRFGVDYSTIDIAGFEEVGQKNRPDFDTGLELAYKRQHRDSLTTKLGIFASYALGMDFGVLVPQFTAEWVHEFLNEQRTIFFKFREDNAGAQLRFQTDEPDRNYFRVGLGLVLVLPKNISAFINYRTLLGYNDRIAHTLNAGLRVGF